MGFFLRQVVRIPIIEDRMPPDYRWLPSFLQLCASRSLSVKIILTLLSLSLSLISLHSYFLQSFDTIVETLKNEPVATPCVFSCQVQRTPRNQISNIYHNYILQPIRWGRAGLLLVLWLLASSRRSRSQKSSGFLQKINILFSFLAPPKYDWWYITMLFRKMEELKLISTETLRDLIHEKFERMPDYPKTAEEEDPLAKVCLFSFNILENWI